MENDDIEKKGNQHTIEPIEDVTNYEGLDGNTSDESKISRLNCESEVVDIKEIQDHSENFSKRALQIILPDPNGQTDSLFRDDMSLTAQFYFDQGFEQKVVELSLVDYNDLCEGKISSDLKREIDWVKQAKDGFEIRLNEHSHFEKEKQSCQAKDLANVLYQHGIDHPDFKEKGTIHWDACYTGRDNPLTGIKAQITELADHLSKKGTGGLKYKAPKFKTAVNCLSLMPNLAIGISLIKRPNGTYASMDEKNLRGKFKFMKSFVSDSETSKIAQSETYSEKESSSNTRFDKMTKPTNKLSTLASNLNNASSIATTDKNKSKRNSRRI